MSRGAATGPGPLYWPGTRSIASGGTDGTGGRAPRKGGGGMCLRYCSESTGQGCKGVFADGSSQPGSYKGHGYTRPLSSSPVCADAVLARSKAISAVSTNCITWVYHINMPRRAPGLGGSMWRNGHGRRHNWGAGHLAPPGRLIFVA